MTTIEMNQKIQSLYTHMRAHPHTHTHTQQRNIKERHVTIKRIIQMLKLLKD